MFFKRVLLKQTIIKNNFLYNPKIFHVTYVNKKKRIIFFVKWDKDYKYCEFIEKKN